MVTDPKFLNHGNNKWLTSTDLFLLCCGPELWALNLMCCGPMQWVVGLGLGLRAWCWAIVFNLIQVNFVWQSTRERRQHGFLSQLGDRSMGTHRLVLRNPEGLLRREAVAILVLFVSKKSSETFAMWLAYLANRWPAWRRSWYFWRKQRLMRTYDKVCFVLGCLAYNGDAGGVRKVIWAMLMMGGGS